MSSVTVESPAIQTVALTKRFGGIVAVDRVDLTVERGELFSLLGPNGAGKTTTIKMLCCLTRPTGGSASIMGHDIAKAPLSVKAVIDVSPQETAIAGNLSATENLMLMARLHGFDKRVAQSRSEELLEMMGLSARANEKTKKLSGGMKRRLSIAMALVSDPEVLFLDEPTLGLDPQSRNSIWAYIEGLKGAKTIVLTTHYLEEADALADRIAIIDDGRVVALGTPGELKAAVSDTPVIVVETTGLTEQAVDALREIYPQVRRFEAGLEIEGDDISLYEIEDCLRPRGVTIQATHRRRVTLDDVFLELTGKQLRE
ncbi:MAG: ATP-binding cassette domain-containing protein [Acidimicrobiia bacterium]|nr:ATP-binding cassette domain-containing protein [Acidimicrobiia bacterium]